MISKKSPSFFTGKRVNAAGAGPRITFPLKSYCEPWQGHSNFDLVLRTSHPACVQVVETAKKSPEVF
jgi:hypothetical protein